MNETQMQTQMSPIDFHHGEALFRVAGHYPTLAEVMYEGVQNALDANATVINITINHKNRAASIEDDGDGTSKTKFEEALTSVCRSIKDGDKLGQFGMGLIAPLGKCQRFTFTSTSKSNPRAYLRWTFDTATIREQDKIQGIPMEAMTDIHFQHDPDTKGAVPWRTRVDLINFTKDRILSRLTAAQLRDGILERFSAAMRHHSTVVIIKIKSADGESETEKVMANEYEGRRLPVEYIRDKDAGQTTFRIYVANKTSKGRKGKVVVGESNKDFRISFVQFARHAGDWLEPDEVEALTSGVFEGEILTEKAKLNPSRKYFQINDALVGLCITIIEWYRKVGEKHVAKLKEEKQDDRYQRLGLRSMHVMEALLEQAEFGHLRDVVKSFKVGTIGIHHAHPDTKVLGPQTIPSVSIHGDQGGSSKKNDNGGNEREAPKAEHTEHTPYTVGGPKGRQRMLVKSNSLGLQFLYEEMEGSDKLWELDNVAGILHYNTRHPLWARCEPDEKALMRFQEHVALMALTLETVPPDWKDRHRRMVDDSLGSFVFWLLKGDELAGRKTGAGLAKHNEARKKAKADPVGKK